MTTETDIKAKTVRELAAEYGVSCTTLRKWLLPIITRSVNPLGEKTGNFYLPYQVRLIYSHLDNPENRVS